MASRIKEKPYKDWKEEDWERVRKKEEVLKKARDNDVKFIRMWRILQPI